MIKQFGRLLAFFGLIFGCLGWMGHQAAIGSLQCRDFTLLFCVSR